MLISLCRFFKTVPSVILAEDAEILQLMTIYQAAHPEGGGDDG